MGKKTYNISEYDEWNFIEENLPNYHRRDDILYNDIVCRYVNGEDIDAQDLEMMKSHFKSVEEAEKWLDSDYKRLFLEAVEAAYDSHQIASISVIN